MTVAERLQAVWGERLPTKFPLIHCYSDEKELTTLGYRAFAISTFDHWLGEDEASARLLFYPRNKAPAELLEYRKIEEAFWSLHLALSSGPVFKIDRLGLLAQVNPYSRRFQDLWRASRREIRPRGHFLDLFYGGPKVRMIHNWDLTDWAFFRDNESMDDVATAADRAGLHVLR